LGLRIRFLTSTPLDIRRGSGTYVGITVLAEALRGMGHAVEIETPRRHFSPYTLERLAFNRGLRAAAGFDLTVGFDLDGYGIAENAAHVAALKGVIADEVRFERGLTRLTMSVQAHCERLHARRAARVVTTSRYSAERAREFYGLAEMPGVAPEPIDLGEWRRMLEKADKKAGGPTRAVGSGPAKSAGTPRPTERFTALFVGRMYRRKRVDVLLRAAAELRGRIPDFEVRMVGGGPHAGPWRELARELKLEGTVTWLGDVTRAALAEEYNRADLFCLPSVQEGFGIVLLEAMAAGKPIVAARAGAIPEVAAHAELVEAERPEALAAAMEGLYRSPVRRAAMAAEGLRRVEQFNAPLVAAQFLEAAG